MDKKVSKQTIKIFLHYAWSYKLRLIFCIFGAMTAVLASSFLSPYIISRILNEIQNNPETLSLVSVKPLILAYIGSQIYGELIGWRLTLLCVWTMEVSAQRDLQRKIFNHLTSQSMKFHANSFGGSLVSQTNKFIGSFERFWDTIVFQLMPTFTSIVGANVILMFIFWQYALVLEVISLIFLVIVIAGSKIMAKKNIKESKASTKLTGRLSDVISNILAVKSHGHEDYEIAEYDKLSKKWHSKSMSTMWSFLALSSVYSGLMVVLNVVALIGAVYATENKMITLSTVYLCVSYTLTVARQLWEMNNIMRNYNRIMGDAHEMTLILGKQTDITDLSKPEDSNITRGSITFDNVTFTHDESDDALFNKLNLNIKPGEKIGIVGHSGSGKTTLTKVLLRFMDIQSGYIRIDGQNIAKLRQSELRKLISYVPQEPVLFHRTLKENIAYGDLDTSEDAITAVAKLAHADEFIQKLPKKYNTLVGERGVKLSGGQRQRVAIARAMIKNAPIILLDEATSALDSESEALIQDALWKLMENKTAIVIAHRLSTVQKMDRIIVMEEGKIVEEGSHSELIKKAGIYADLWNRQSGGFID